ncbi:hypothetical protein STTU_4052 [Streptomyces sp. Tu6071]|nr:hypothetical protein STTU_4052 [Streptomyces sp. Tu6071]
MPKAHGAHTSHTAGARDGPGADRSGGPGTDGPGAARGEGRRGPARTAILTRTGTGG